MDTQSYGLKSFIHRKLAVRLLLGGLLIASVLSAATYFARYEHIGEAASIHAINAIEQLKVRIRNIKKEPGITLSTATQQALNEDPDYRVTSKYGHFVYARFYTPDRTPIAERAYVDESHSFKLEDFMQQSQLYLPKMGQPWNKKIDIGDQSYIHVVIPIANSEGVLAAYGEGLYELSDLTITSAYNEALRMSAYVMLIVIATSLLLYPIIISLSNRLANFSEQLLNANLETIQVLGNAIAKRDSDTDAHNYRVTLYAIHLAEGLELNIESVRGLIKGAFLHDVGKIGVRDNILHKPGPLDDCEFEIMKAHVDHGLEIINRCRWLGDATDVVGSHHEKYNGSGYPNQLRGERIPITARIFAIVDVFDALTSRRPYKEPFTLEEAMRILEQGRGIHFDPKLLDLFTNLASSLYQRYGGREDEKLHQELTQIVQKYFTSQLNTLVY